MRQSQSCANLVINPTSWHADSFLGKGQLQGLTPIADLRTRISAPAHIRSISTYSDAGIFLVASHNIVDLAHFTPVSHQVPARGVAQLWAEQLRNEFQATSVTLIQLHLWFTHQLLAVSSMPLSSIACA